MQDAIGIGLLFGMALLFKLFFCSTTMLDFQYHDVYHVFPFSVIAFWALLSIATLWLLAVGFAFVARPH
jgi:hypothetical protein